MATREKHPVLERLEKQMQATEKQAADIRQLIADGVPRGPLDRELQRYAKELTAMSRTFLPHGRRTKRTSDQG